MFTKELLDNVVFFIGEDEFYIHPELDFLRSHEINEFMEFYKKTNLNHLYEIKINNEIVIIIKNKNDLDKIKFLVNLFAFPPQIREELLKITSF